MTIVPLGLHTAFLDLEAGIGLLVCPGTEADIRDPLSPVEIDLATIDYRHAVTALANFGFEVWEDEHGDTFTEGYTADGHEAISLYRTHGPEPDPDEHHAALRQLAAEAGVTLAS